MFIEWPKLRGRAETILFLCQDKVSGTRYLYLLSGGAILEIRPLNSALHLAQGDIIAGNRLTEHLFIVYITISCMLIILMQKQRSNSRRVFRQERQFLMFLICS